LYDLNFQTKLNKTMKTTAKPNQENEKVLKNTLMLILLFIVVLLFLCFFSGNLSAQDNKRDSLKRAAFIRDSLTQDSIAYISKIRTIAKWDARKQKLSPSQTQQFKADLKNNHSDLFKPQKRFVPDTTMLQDSVYVKAFRLAAYERAMDDNAIIQRCIWGAFGPGIGTAASNDINFTINGSIELPKRQLFSADLRVASGVLGGTATTAFSLLYGGIFKQQYSFFTVSAGFSVVNVATNNFNLFSTEQAVNTSNFGIGVPIILQGYFVVGQHVGFGISAYVNLNSAQTIAGVNLSFAFGRLTTHERKQ
jgi:hypothetical protein